MSTVREGGWSGYAAAWASRYGGYDLRRAPAAVRGWQRLAYRVGRGLAAVRVPARTLDLLGLALAIAVPVVVARGGAWLLLAAGLVVAATLAGSVAAAMAVLGSRSSRAAAIRQSVTGLLREIAWLVAFWLVGVAGPLVVACGVLSGLHEYVRALALGAGMSRVAAQTAGDRPVRLLLVALGLALAGLAGDELAAGLLTVTGAIWLALAALGLSQLVGAVRRSLG